MKSRTLGELIYEIECLRWELLRLVPALDLDIDAQLYEITRNIHNGLTYGVDFREKFIEEIDKLLKDYQ